MVLRRWRWCWLVFCCRRGFPPAVALHGAPPSHARLPGAGKSVDFLRSVLLGQIRARRIWAGCRGMRRRLLQGFVVRGLKIWGARPRAGAADAWGPPPADVRQYDQDPSLRGWWWLRLNNASGQGVPPFSGVVPAAGACFVVDGGGWPRSVSPRLKLVWCCSVSLCFSTVLRFPSRVRDCSCSWM